MNLNLMFIEMMQEPIYQLCLAVIICLTPLLIFYLIQCNRNWKEFKRGEEYFAKQESKRK